MRQALVFLPILLALTACDSPTPGMARGEKTEVTIDGSRFSVYRRDDRVEVIRTSREWLPDRTEYRAKAQMAIRQATGCKVRGNSFDGDQAMAKARLNCSGDLPPLERVGPQAYDCHVVADWESEGRNARTTEIYCEPI
ncbi:hypothetical protein [Aliiroseovarius sp.]|uniref:hypothetical protein n=1 Tax=Aliiroseovarius sp. TaxID=1872442 RepID=UPI003BADB7BF